MEKPNKLFRISFPIRLLLGALGIGLGWTLISLLIPMPLPAWARFVFTLQIGLTILLLGGILRLVWEVVRKK